MEGSLRKLVTRNSWSDRIDVEDETVDSIIRCLIGENRCGVYFGKERRALDKMNGGLGELPLHLEEHCFYHVQNDNEW